MKEMMSKRILAGVAMVLIGVGGMVVPMSCMTKDNSFGSEFIPPHQIMQNVVDSTIQVFTYIDVYDSVQTNLEEQYTLSIGSIVDTLTGRTTIQGFSNYAPIGFEHRDYFGIDPVIDSMTFGLTVAYQRGDSNQTYTLDVYEVVNRNFKLYDEIYSNLDMTPYIKDTPLCSFDLPQSGSKVVKLPMTFAERFLDNTPGEDNIYWIDTTFHEKFNGFYFKLRNEKPTGEGALFSITLGQSVMTLFYHNKGQNFQEVPTPDTLEQRYLFFGDYTIFNTNFITVQHDYTEADPLRGGVPVAAIRDSVNPSEYCYIEGLASLMTKIRVNEDDIKRIQSEVEAKGYRHVAIQKAELQVSVASPTPEEYARSFTQLGIYHSILEPNFLSEYNPVLAGIYGSGYTSTLGGGVSRSKGKYIFDITSHVQKLFTGKETRFTTEMAMAYAFQNYDLRTRVYGFNSPHPPLLILTYTMVK